MLFFLINNVNLFSATEQPQTLSKIQYKQAQIPADYNFDIMVPLPEIIPEDASTVDIFVALIWKHPVANNKKQLYKIRLNVIQKGRWSEFLLDSTIPA